MTRLPRSIAIGAAFSLLVIGGPVAGAGAAPQDPPPAAPQAREAPSEFTGRAASLNAMRSGRLSCGDVITRSTILKASVGPCDGPGIIVGADNITLDLNGYSVIGNFDHGAAGEFGGIVLQRRTGVTVVGNDSPLPTVGTGTGEGTVEGFEAGVVIRRGSGNEVRDLTVQDNVGLEDVGAADLGDGIIMFSSSQNRILNNSVFRNGIFDGIGGSGVGTESNLIQGNTSSDNLGVDDFRSPSAGIALGSGTADLTVNDNRIIDNTVERNYRAGIYLTNARRATVLNNVANQNGSPDVAFSVGIIMNALIVVDDSDLADDHLALNSLVEGNTANGNGQVGILLDLGAANNTVRANVALANGFIGIGNGFRAYNNLYDSNTALRHAFIDLYDGAFPDDPNRCGAIWVNNVYETAFPEHCIS